MRLTSVLGAVRCRDGDAHDRRTGRVSADDAQLGNMLLGPRLDAGGAPHNRPVPVLLQDCLLRLSTSSSADMMRLLLSAPR